MSATATLNDDHGLIGQRRARSLEAARRRTGFVRRLRMVLAVGIGVVALNAIVQMVLSGSGGSSELGFDPAGGAERIVSPRFTGRDERGVPFVITAEAAVRQAGDAIGITRLERPALDYALLETTDGASRVLAETGEYNGVEQTLRLRSAVRLTTRSGYAFETEEALLRLDEGVVIGDYPVYGEAPWGAVRADSFEVRDDGQRIILRGDVRNLILETASGPRSAEESEE